MEEKIHHLEQGVLSGNREAVRTACRQLLEAGMPPQKIVRFGLLPCMDTLGQQLSRREKFIPQIMMSARAVQDGIDLLSPLIVGPDVLSLSETVVLGNGTSAEVVVTHSRYPRFVGALIVCEGGDRADVQLKVTQAVSALTGLSSERISVVKGTP